MSQLKKGALLSYIKVILTNVIGLVLTPFIIKSLGDAEYGLYTLIGAFVGYISLMDLGLNNTIIRFVAKYRAENDKKGEENFLSTTMLIYGTISIFVVIIGVILYLNLDTIFSNSLTLEEMNKAKVMFVVLIFNIAITLPGGAFTAICNGYEHFVFPRAINISRYLIRSVAVVGLLLLGGDAIGLVLLDTIVNILVIVLMGSYVLNKLKVVFKLHSFQIPLIKQIFSYSIWIFVFAIVLQFQWSGGQVILGIKTDTITVAIYAVGIALGTYYGSFSGAISSVFLPKATQMVVKNSTSEELTLMMIKIGRLSLIVLLFILGAFLLFGNQFINLWVGKTYEESWLVALIIMLAYTIPLTQNFANSLLEARNKYYFKAVVYLVFIMLGTVSGWILVDYFDIIGMVAGITLGWLVALIIMNVYYHRIMKLNIVLFFTQVFKKLLWVFITVIFFGYFINKLPGVGWINLFIKNSLYLIIYGLLIFLLGMNSYEKSLCKKLISFKF